jgi:hypothetical protein
MRREGEAEPQEINRGELMATQQLVPTNGHAGVILREEFGARQAERQAERETAAVTAREEAIIKAEYLVAERRPRVWSLVRQEMLQHCSRPRFAEVSRYAKPVGKKFVNGEWIEEKARGFTARFAETLRQEMGNIKPIAQVTYEDDLMRFMRFGVVDLQKNIPRYREVAFAKTVEKRGKQDKRTKEWTPPEGREIISSRINSYGDPTYLVKATDDEMRNKVNSEESKTQRDFTLALCPRDILEECLDAVTATLEREDKSDPLLAVKRIVDRFREFGVLAGDLETYIGRAVNHFTADDLKELRELGAAIRDGQTSFQDALRIKFTAPDPDDLQETKEQRVDRLKRQMEEQYTEAAKREAPPATSSAPPPEAPILAVTWPSKEEMLNDFTDVRAEMPEERFVAILQEHKVPRLDSLKTDAKARKLFRALCSAAGRPE